MTTVKEELEASPSAGRQPRCQARRPGQYRVPLLRCDPHRTSGRRLWRGGVRVRSVFRLGHGGVRRGDVAAGPAWRPAGGHYLGPDLFEPAIRAHHRSP